MGCCQAATCCLETVSALVPIAQIKPSNSRATAVTIFLWSLPAAPSFKYRLCSLCCAFHAISLGLFRDALLSSSQTVPDTWRTTIAPCSFDNDASQVRIAGLRKPSASGSLTAGILAWYNAAVTHQLPSTLEAGYLAQLTRNGHSRDVCETAQCLQISDDLLQRW